LTSYVAVVVWRRSSRQRQRLRAAFVAEEHAERAGAAGVERAAHDAMTAAPEITVTPATVAASASPAVSGAQDSGTPAAPTRDAATQARSSS